MLFLAIFGLFWKVFDIDILERYGTFKKKKKEEKKSEKKLE